MMVRTFNIAVALVLLTSSAQAQTTTYVPPSRETVQARQMVAAADSARRDSIADATMTDMKAWVDSAAGVPLPATIGRVDSTALVNDPGRPVTTFSNGPERPVTTFSDGSVAPATASNLPTLVVVGVVFLVLGSVLLANRSRG